MSATDQLVLAANKALAIQDDIALLKAVGAVVSRWTQLAKELVDYPSAKTLLEAIIADVDGDTIAAAFKAVGLEAELADLRGLLKRVGNAAGQVPPEVEALLSRVSSFPLGASSARVAWGLATSDGPVAKTERYNLDLGGGIGVSLDAGASWPGDAPPARRLKVSAKGTAKAGGKATAPFAFKLGAEVGASASLALDYYFAPDPDEIYAMAVGERLGRLADPYDLESVWAAFQRSDFDGLVYKFGGAANGNVTLAFADAAALAAGITVNASFEVGVSASLKSDYTLTLRRAGQGFTAKLSRSKVSEAGYHDKLGLDVDVSVLTKPVAESIKRAVEKWDATLASIKAYLSPGDWLRTHFADLLKDRLTALISSPELRAAALSDTNGALGLATADNSAIVKWLEDKLVGAINQGSVLVTDPVGGAIDKVEAALIKVIPLLAGQLPAGQLKTLIKDLVDKAAAGLSDDVKAIFDAQGVGLGQVLKDAGAQVTGAVNSLNAALKGVRDLLSKCDTVFHEILDKAELAAKSKVTARLFRAETSSDGETVEVSGTFTSAADDSTRRVFEALTRGSLAHLERLVDGQEIAPGFTLKAEESSITRFSRFKSEEGLEIAFIKVLLKASTLIDGGATVTIGGDGNVHVDTEAKLKKTVWSPLNSREVSFTETHGLVAVAAAAAAGSGKAKMDLGLGAAFADKSMNWKDVSPFIDDLDDAKLLTPGAAAGVKAAFDRWAPGGGKIDGEIGAKMSLTSDKLAVLLRLDQRSDAYLFEPPKAASGLPYPVQAQIIKRALATAIRRKIIKPERFEDGMNMAASHFKSPQLPPPVLPEHVILNYWAKIFDNLKAAEDGLPKIYPLPPGFPQETQPYYEYFVMHGFALRRIMDMIDIMGAIYQARPSVGGGPGWVQRDYRDQQKRLLEDSKVWMQVLKDIASLFSSTIGPRTVALMRVLTDLSGRSVDNPGGVILTLTWRPKGKPAQTVSFG